MALLSFVNTTLALGTIASQVCIVLIIAYALFFRKTDDLLLLFMGKYGMLFAGIVSLIAAASSLFYSQVAGFTPCDLCWFQRIFMYPEVIIIGLALIKKEAGKIADYALALAIIGFLVSLYHNYVNYSGISASCQILGAGVSCVKRYIFEFGYVTIPIMTLTAFGLIIVCIMFSKLYNSSVAQ